jgi:adenylosuccinate synthase
MVLVRQAVRTSGIAALAITKLDVLTGLETIKICTGYESVNGNYTSAVPASIDEFAQCRPVYEEFTGWKEDISRIRDFADLPVNARKYLQRLEILAGVPLNLVSVGAGREETIILKNPFRD